MQVDLDLGNYERFLDIKLTRDNNITTGKVYQVRVRLLSFVDFSLLVYLVSFFTSVSLPSA